MTTESVVPEVLHPWAIYLRASEEARRRGDRRTGTDHILLALFEDPSIGVVLGVSLQQARQALESLDQEALGALGMGSGTDAPPLPMRAVPNKPRIRDVMKKDRLRMTPAAKKVLEAAVKPNRRKAPCHGPAGAGPDPRSPTTRSCGGAVGCSRREHVGGSAPIGCGHARGLSPQRHSRRAKVSGSGRLRASNNRERRPLQTAPRGPKFTATSASPWWRSPQSSYPSGSPKRALLRALWVAPWCLLLGHGRAAVPIRVRSIFGRAAGWPGGEGSSDPPCLLSPCGSATGGPRPMRHSQPAVSDVSTHPRGAVITPSRVVTAERRRGVPLAPHGPGRAPG